MTIASKGFAEKDRVRHLIHGVGTISSIDKSYTIINFDAAGRKTFVTDLLQLDPSDEPAPVPKKKSIRPKKK